MLNSQIKGEEIHSEELLKYIAINTAKTKVVRCTTYWTKGKQDVQDKVMSCYLSALDIMIMRMAPTVT